MNSKDILLGVVGTAISLYGGKYNDLFALTSGIIVLIIAIYLSVLDQENDIKILKAQINTHMELKKIWREIDELKQKREG